MFVGARQVAIEVLCGESELAHAGNIATSTSAAVSSTQMTPRSFPATISVGPVLFKKERIRANEKAQTGLREGETVVCGFEKDAHTCAASAVRYDYCPPAFLGMHSLLLE